MPDKSFLNKPVSAVVLPTYCEAENIESLIREIQELKLNLLIVVIDDSSPDGTAEIVKKIQREYDNILLLVRTKKLGLGTAIRDGLRIALSFPNCRNIITMDADHSHNPKDVPRLLRKIENVDLIQGSRYIKGGKIIGWSPFRRAVSYVANLLCRVLFRTHLHDHTSYFRVYSRKFAETAVANVYCEQYEWAIGSLLVAKDHNFRIKELPITFVDRISGKSKLRFSDIFRWTHYVSKTFLKRSLNQLCKSDIRKGS